MAALDAALMSEDRRAVQVASQMLFTALTGAFGIGPCRVEVLAARPHGHWGELQGLYTDDRRLPRVQLWMRTARQRRVVAFRTYLRTLLHELGHHIDYRYLKLADSFHTQGFYMRESSLFHQLVPDARASHDRRAPSRRRATSRRRACAYATAEDGSVRCRCRHERGDVPTVTPSARSG